METVWVRRTMEALRGVEFVHSYGLNETSPLLTTLGGKQHLVGRQMRAGGRPLVGVDIRIVDEEGNDLPAGGAGEIVV